MLELPDSWVWDFWFADDGERFHVFFLYASRALGDPDARHARASVGHAVSDDLVHWDRVRDALVHADPPAVDDLATWTGSIIAEPDGSWSMFYTGVSAHEQRTVQQVCRASSTDLLTWQRHGPVLRADPLQHEPLSHGKWADEAFRDPWVFRDPGEDGWHLLITARANHGPLDDRGILAHAWSADLRTWEHRESITAAGQGFGQLEVAQVELVDGRAVLLFSCLDTEVSAARRATGASGGTWYVPAPSLLGPFDIAAARQLTDRTRYSGRIVRDRSGQWQYLSFVHDGPDGNFVGRIDDPRPIGWQGDALVLGRA